MSSTENDTRTQILAQTLSLMETTHGKDVRLKDIAKAAGVSRQAIYMHFGSRAGLLVETARYIDLIKNNRERTREMREAQTGTAMLKAFIDFWTSYIPDVYGLARALMYARQTDSDADEAWGDRMRSVYDRCHRISTLLHQEGKLASVWTVDEAADFLWSLVAITNWEHLTIERGWSQEQYYRHIHRIAFNTLLETEN